MITMEKIDYVISMTGEGYSVVRKALLDTNGDVDKAIDLLKTSRQDYLSEDDHLEEGTYEDYYEKKSEEGFKDAKEDVENFVDQVVDAIKEIWHKGNASRLAIENEEGKTVLSVSLNVSALAIAIKPVIALIGLGATVISKYSIKVYMDDGEVIDIKKYIGL